MAVPLTDLVPAFREPCEELLHVCWEKNKERFVPYCTLRTPIEQAKLWRQSRSIATIKTQLARLRVNSAHFIADCIEKVGPQNGKPVTGSIPGQSWHQFGEAMDCFYVDSDGQESWHSNYYRFYATTAQRLGLTCGHFWRIVDSGHVQFRSESPLEYYGGWEKLDAALKERWGHLL